MRARERGRITLLAAALLAALGAVLLAEVSISTAAVEANPLITLTALPLQVSQPVHIANAGDGSGRLFVVERAGRIQVFKNNQLLSTPFLSITDRVRSIGAEEGLLSIAFPPDYAAFQHFFVYYVDVGGNLAISRFGLTGNRDVADQSSEIKILGITHPVNSNHNGGQLQFGPDGFLYIGTGDGGSGGDPLNNAQNTSVLLGKLLRIDPVSSYPSVQTYTIPSSNPYTLSAGYRGEIWALGLRNPWRFSFDRGTGDLFVGDVGQNTAEEVDRQPAGSHGGENYGWSCYEAMGTYSASRCSPSITYTFPITFYVHAGTSDCSITGGYVYRGSQYRYLQGNYLYADYCSGNIWAVHPDGLNWVGSQIFRAPFNISSFGEDESGALYVAAFNIGQVYRLGVVEPAVYLPLLFR